MNFFEKYREDLKISDREKTMEEALALLVIKKREPRIIVETGCIRMKHDTGAGQSTLVFGDFCHHFGSHLFTVDNNPDALYIAQSETEEFKDFITYVENDSIEFLKTFNQKIDLLYLDSMDCPEYDDPLSVNLIKSQIHQLLELEAAWDKLSDDPVILLDDNSYANGGKTRLAKVFLKERGFMPVLEGKQALFIKAVGENYAE